MRLLNADSVQFFAWNRENEAWKNVENLIWLRCRLRHIDVFETRFPLNMCNSSADIHSCEFVV